MRIVYSGLFALAGLLAFHAPMLAQAPKLGYVDSQRILRETPGAEDIQQQLQQAMQGFDSQAKALQDSLQKIVTDFQQRSAVLTEEARNQQEQQIMATRDSLGQQLAQIQQQAQQKEQELLQPFLKQIEDVIHQIRREEGYAMIFDIASPGVVSYDESLDLTNMEIGRAHV